MATPQYEAGKQIKIICSGCLVWDLNTREGIAKLLMKMCYLIDMTRLGGPYIEEVNIDGGNGEEDGISGLLMIMQSHCSAHAWDKYRAVRITVDSCKDFDSDKLVEFLINELLPSKIRVAHEVWE